VGFLFALAAPAYPHSQQQERLMDPHPDTKLIFSADTAAILIAFALGALIRLNLIPHIGW
jgi:hypothetical protein